MKDFKSMGPDEIRAFIEEQGEAGFRAKQIFQWINRGIYDFDEMSNLPLTLREKLKGLAFIEGLEIEQVQVSKKDGTKKYLFRMKDGNSVESVFMKYRHGNTVCISSQAGCRMACSFCASGIGGLSANLSPGEMLDQVLAIKKETGENINNVVVMGIGEPFDNYDNLSQFLKLIHHEDGLGMSYRSVTVSSCGIIPKIEQFALDFPQVNLAISLHGPNDEIRGQLMPINKKYPVDELLGACRDYTNKTHRRITFEYALIKDVNNQRQHAKELAEKLKGMLCHVNLIALNPVEEKPYKASSDLTVKEFEKILSEKGIQVTIRRSLGTDIDGACGQLRMKNSGSEIIQQDGFLDLDVV